MQPRPTGGEPKQSVSSVLVFLALPHASFRDRGSMNSDSATPLNLAASWGVLALLSKSWVSGLLNREIRAGPEQPSLHSRAVTICSSLFFFASRGRLFLRSNDSESESGEWRVVYPDHGCCFVGSWGRYPIRTSNTAPYGGRLFTSYGGSCMTAVGTLLTQAPRGIHGRDGFFSLPSVS